MREIDEMRIQIQALVAMAAGMSTDTVILADQGRSADAFGLSLYATYNPIPVRAYGQVRIQRKAVAPVEEVDASLGEDWTDFNETACSALELMISVNFFNAGAAQAAMMLQNANFRLPVSQYLFQNKIAWRYASTPRNLSALYQAGIQQRYQSDIQLFVEHSVSYSVLRAAGIEIITHE